MTITEVFFFEEQIIFLWINAELGILIYAFFGMSIKKRIRNVRAKLKRN